MDCKWDLSAGMTYRLTLVITSHRLSAGALPAPSYVVALTPAHNEPCRYCEALARALAPIVGPLPLDGLAPDDGIVELLNAVTAATSPSSSDFALVLWDYDVIDLPAIHAATAMMVDYLPPSMHVIIIARRVPPLVNIPRLRARRQLLEIIP